MKIVSSFKDYYDFMASRFGVDEKIVYHRTSKDGLYKPPHTQARNKEDLPLYQDYRIAFCGTLYSCFWLEGNIYFGEEILKVSESVVEKYEYYKNLRPKTRESEIMEEKYLMISNSIPISLSKNIKRRMPWWYPDFDISPKETKLNETEDCPVLLVSENNTVLARNLRLADFGFASVLPAENAWIRIVNFLTREPAPPKPLNDQQKIVSHGFDLKTSFRKEKKSKS